MENIVKTEQLYEGKAKKVFATNDPDLVIVDYKDDATAFNGEKKGTIVGKGAINNKMTNYMFKLLEKEGCHRRADPFSHRGHCKLRAKREKHDSGDQQYPSDQKTQQNTRRNRRNRKG